MNTYKLGFLVATSRGLVRCVHKYGPESMALSSAAERVGLATTDSQSGPFSCPGKTDASHCSCTARKAAPWPFPF